jgi:NADH dehydrogenase FAD-containing subunit
VKQESIVIVGAGHSGAKAAAALRKHGWTGGLTLIGDESCVPCDRPPLSKAVLLGKKTSEQCALFRVPGTLKTASISFSANRLPASIGVLPGLTAEVICESRLVDI